MPASLVLETTPILAGQFVCGQPSGRAELCDRPRQVAGVDGDLILLVRSHSDGPEYIAREQVVYVCDTEDEGNALHAISTSRAVATREAKRVAIRAVEARFEPQVSALLGGAALAAQNALDAARWRFWRERGEFTYDPDDSGLTMGFDRIDAASHDLDAELTEFEHEAEVDRITDQAIAYFRKLDGEWSERDA